MSVTAVSNGDIYASLESGEEKSDGYRAHVVVLRAGQSSWQETGLAASGTLAGPFGPVYGTPDTQLVVPRLVHVEDAGYSLGTLYRYTDSVWTELTSSGDRFGEFTQIFVVDASTFYIGIAYSNQIYRWDGAFEAVSVPKNSAVDGSVFASVGGQLFVIESSRICPIRSRCTCGSTFIGTLNDLALTDTGWTLPCVVNVAGGIDESPVVLRYYDASSMKSRWVQLTKTGLIPADASHQYNGLAVGPVPNLFDTNETDPTIAVFDIAWSVDGNPRQTKVLDQAPQLLTGTSACDVFATSQSGVIYKF